jgi:signal transduction histidine kinase/DNA-binding response OmpR family regulator
LDAPKERILVIDDESTIATVIRGVLEESGFEVVVDFSAEEGLGHLPGGRFAVAITDIVLPGMNGLAFLAEARRISPGTEVIVMTSQTTAESAIEAIRLGAYDYLQKPFEDLETVSITVERAVEKHRLSGRNAALVAELEKQNQDLATAVTRLSSLVDAGRSMGDFRSVRELLDYFLEVVTWELGVERASIMLLDADTGELQIVAAHGINDFDPSQVRMRLGEGVAGRVAQTGEPFLVGSVCGDPRLAREGNPGLSDSFLSAPIVLSLPIKSWQKVLGVVNLTNRATGEPFDHNDLAYVSGMTGQVAVALERTRHHEELQRAYESLKAAQTQLVFSERVKAIGQMAAGVAHDFNNILGTILGRAQLALMKTESENPDTAQLAEDLRVLARVALQGAETIKRIQKFTRSREETPRLPIDLNETIIDALEMTRPKWKIESESVGQPIVIENDLPEIPPILGNANDLSQALANLIFNAVEAMPDGGTLRIRSRRESGRVLLEVEDSGVGISRETRGKIFDPFFTTKKTGNGLGLSIVRGIVESHGGEISVTSDEGRGAVFRMSFPVASAAASAIAPSRKAGDARGNPASVLLVDDGEEIRQSYSELLASGGHKVTQAKGGREALAILQARTFDVVITDLTMPVVSGLDVAREAKKLHPGCHVVLITGWTGEMRDEKFRRAGVDRVLVKPCLMADLLGAVADATGARTPIPSWVG